ncbi:hypothetical protein EVJ58_g3254 [Rhodofomes roseus]|uniref:Cytochrome P450 n=1 Tax=Rhodofomes roseus TaxID=34475 RepID=A0A4Y9YLJ8_9APHY|nr:hypothetical protein EVJ58_g3254 [Rhodofomes roseus]
MQEHSRKMLLNFAVSPEQFVSHIRKNAASLILQISYGRTSEDQIDYFVKVVEDAVATQAHLVRPGQWLVNTYPILRFIPSWFPFAEFKRVAAYYKEQYKRVDSLLYTWAKDQIKTGDYVESFVSLNLRPDGISQEEDDILRWCSSALYAGASDTTVGILISFVLLMTLHPEVQRRAQEEVDRVCEGRLPTWDDEPNMPYVGAMIKETDHEEIGLPHVVTQDDMYEGYLIPKGVTVLANIWAIAHDETMYPSPFAFDPNRFLGPEPQFDPLERIPDEVRAWCLGQHFAETSLFLNVSSLLAVFNIAKAVDEKGREIEPDVRWTSRLTSHAENFACNITVRSPELLESLARTD